MKFESIKDMSEEMLSDDSARDMANDAYDKLVHMDWHLPKEWKELGWIKEMKSSEPYDIIRSATRVLSTKEPQIQLTPIFDNQETRNYFNEIEKALKWHYKQAGRRAHSLPTRDIVESVLRYDELIVNVVDMRYQDAALKAIGGKRGKVANQFGPYAVIVHKPTNVHVRYSDYMPEAVFLKRPVKVYKVVKFWGERAKWLAELYEDDMNAKVIECDFTTLDQRCVWIWEHEEQKIFGENEEYNIPFLPWAARVGGTAMDIEEERKRQPILYSNYKTDAYHTQNLFRSLMYSLAMHRAAEPITDVTSPDGSGIEIDATQPAGQIAHMISTTVKRLPPAGVDPVVKEMHDRMVQEQEGSSGTQILQAGNVPGDVAFATFNARMQAATAHIDPAKDMAEKGIADVLGLFVQWAKFMKEPLVYVDESKELTGRNGRLSYKQLPRPEDLYIKVTLEKYVPIDEISKINASVMLTTSFSYPQARALENLGVQDPEQAFKEWRQEQLDKAAVQSEITDMQFEQQMIQQQQMLAQQQAAQQPQPPPSFEQTQGQGFNPAVGGETPMNANPGMTRETITGQPNPTAEGADFRGLGLSVEQMTGRKAVQ